EQMIATLTGYSKNETGVRCYSVRDWSTPMCDYSLELVASRPAKVGDKLVSTSFAHTITRGFVSVDDPNLAVCVLPALSLFSRRRSDARLECCSLGGLGTRWRDSVWSTETGQTSIMTPLNFLMGRSYC